MKTVLRHFIIDTYALWLTSGFAAGMVFQGGFRTLILAGIGVTLVSVVARPVIHLLLLPINLITFGLFRWVGAAIVLFLVTLLVKDFKIMFFDYGGLVNRWIEIPSMHLTGILSIVAFSFILSVITSFIYWLIK